MVAGGPPLADRDPHPAPASSPQEHTSPAAGAGSAAPVAGGAGDGGTGVERPAGGVEAAGTVIWTPAPEGTRGGPRAAVVESSQVTERLGPGESPPAGSRLASHASSPPATPRQPGGAPAPAALHVAEGDVLANRFRVVRFIGRGGMGDVYEAEDLELGERVALKTVRPEIAHLDGAIDRFRREIQLARKVTHPNVCRIFDVFRHRPEASAGAGGWGAASGSGGAGGSAGSGGPGGPGGAGVSGEHGGTDALAGTASPGGARGTGAPGGMGAPGGTDTPGRAGSGAAAFRPGEITFFSMELLVGETLEQRLRGGGTMAPREALPIVRQVADGLTAAHRAGVIHRDFKPGNVMLCGAAGEPRAVITDFGLARTYGEGDGLTVRGDLLGTPSYMAPEQVTGGEVTAATDVYALGCVLYEVITGAPPFVGANSFSTAFKRVQEDPRPPREHVPGLDPAWDAAILRCLERAPADRFAQACDVTAALTGEALAPGPRRRRRLRRRVLAATAAVAAVAAAVLLALRLSGGREGRPAPGIAVVRGSVAPLADLFRSPEALYAEGLKLLGKLDAARAQELFEKAIRGRNDYWLAHSGLAVALADLGHDDRAGKEAKLAFERAAGLPREERLLVTARYGRVEGRWDQALASYQELRAAFPDNVEYGLGAVHALIGAGRGSEALQLVSSLKALPAAAAAAGPRLDIAEAEAAKALSDFVREGRAARRGREQAERDGDDLLAARALCFEGGALGHLGDYPARLAAYKKAEAIYAGAGDQRNLAQVLWATAGTLYFQGNLEQARAKAKEANEIFAELGDLRGQINALSTLAAVDADQGNLVGAQSRFATLVENYRRLGDRTNEAEATSNLGQTLTRLGKLDEAAVRFEQALALYRQLQNRSGEAAELFFLAGVSFNQLDLAKAASYLAQSSSLATVIGDQTRICDDLALEGDVAAARGELTTVRSKRQERLTRGRSLGDKNVVAQSQVALAELELEKGRPSPAQAYAQDALDHFQAEHIPDGEAEARAALARALLAQHSLPEARQAIELADRLAAASKEPEVKITVALAKARLVETAKPEEARRILVGALALAQAAKLGPLALDVRLALGELEAAHGDRRHAAELLAGLEKDARGHGFIQIADRASRAAAGGKQTGG
jgi:serine/threonine protein kinase/tetratricopeptide (TPR) repeat protein